MILSDPHFDVLLRSLLLAIAALVWVTILIRINGLRSLSKMTSFDFVMTVALGSLLAGAAQATGWSGFVQALLAMVGLFVVQYAAARLRKSFEKAEDVIQNEPRLLMRDGQFCRTAMAETRVAEDDLYAKLREANVLDHDEVRAVVLETTGDISVLHGDTLHEDLLKGVRVED